jgi:hypothetical protein
VEGVTVSDKFVTKAEDDSEVTSSSPPVAPAPVASLRDPAREVLGWRRWLPGVDFTRYAVRLLCSDDAARRAILTDMFERHRAPEQAWLVRREHLNLVLPSSWRRLPGDAQPVNVIRDSRHRRWQWPEARFVLDADGTVWASEMGGLLVEDPVPVVSVARYTAQILHHAQRENATPGTSPRP